MIKIAGIQDKIDAYNKEFAGEPTNQNRERSEYARLDGLARIMAANPDLYSDEEMGATFTELHHRRFLDSPKLMTAFDRPNDERPNLGRLQDLLSFTDSIRTSTNAEEQRKIIGEKYAAALPEYAEWMKAKEGEDKGAAFARKYQDEHGRDFGNKVKSLVGWLNPNGWLDYLTDKKAAKPEWQSDFDAIKEVDAKFTGDRLLHNAAQMMPFLPEEQRTLVNLIANGADPARFTGIIRAMKPDDRDTMRSMIQAVRPSYEDIPWIPDEGIVRAYQSVSEGVNGFGRAARTVDPLVATGEWYNPLSWRVHLNDAMWNKKSRDSLQKGMLEDIKDYEALTKTKFEDPQGFVGKALAGFADSAPMQATMIAGEMLKRSSYKAPDRRVALGMQVAGWALEGYTAASMIGEHFDNMLLSGVDLQKAAPLAIAGGLVDAWIETWNLNSWMGLNLSSEQMRRIGIRAAFRAALKRNGKELLEIGKNSAKQALTVTASELGEEIAQAMNKEGVLEYAKGKEMISAFTSDETVQAGIDAIAEALPTCTAFGFTGAIDLTGNARNSALASYADNLEMVSRQLARREGNDVLDMEVREAAKSRVKNTAERVAIATKGMDRKKRNEWLNSREDMTPMERAFYAEHCALREAIEAQNGGEYAAAVMSGSINEALFEKEGWRFDHDDDGRITGITSKDGEHVAIKTLDRKATIEDVGDGLAMFIEEWNDQAKDDQKFKPETINTPEEQERLKKVIGESLNGSFGPNGITLYLGNGYTRDGAEKTLTHELTHKFLADIEKATDRDAKKNIRALGVSLGRAYNENSALIAEDMSKADIKKAAETAAAQEIDWKGIATNVGEALKRATTFGLKKGQWAKVFKDEAGNPVTPKAYFNMILAKAHSDYREKIEAEAKEAAERKTLAERIYADREAKRKAKIAMRKGEKEAKEAERRKAAEEEAKRILAQRREQEAKEAAERREKERKELNYTLNRMAGEMPKLSSAPHLNEMGPDDAALATQKGMTAYRALWKVARKQKLSEKEIDEIGKEYGIPIEVLTNPESLSAETIGKFNDAIIRLWSDASNVKIDVPPVYVATDADRGRILPNEVYDPVFKRFLTGEVIVDPAKAEPFTPAESDVAEQQDDETDDGTPYQPTPFKPRSVTKPAADNEFNFFKLGKNDRTPAKLIGGLWNLLHKPFRYGSESPAPSAQDSSGNGLWHGRRLPSDVASRLDAWKGRCPHYMGNKNEMTARTVKALCDNMSAKERASYTALNDCFGGGGCWGLTLAMTALPNVKRIIVNEFDECRLEKIRLMHTMDGRMEAALRNFLQSNEVIRRTREQLAKIASEGIKVNNNPIQVKTACFNAMRELIESLSNEEKGLLYAFLDDLQHRMNYGVNYNKDTKTYEFDALVEKAIVHIGEDAVKATEMADAFRQNGGTITYSAGDAKLQNDFGVKLDTDGVYRRGASGEALAVPHGANVMSVTDPPYYRTTGYDNDGGQTTVGLAANPYGWGYEDTGKMLKDIVDFGDGIVYTDEAWWLGNYTPDQETLAKEEGILGEIINNFDHFDVAGNVSTRQEVLGVQHGHEGKADNGTDDGNAGNGRAGAESGGVQGIHDATVPGMAGSAEAENGTQPGENGGSSRPRFWDGDPATLADAVANGYVIPKRLSRYADFLLKQAENERKAAAEAELKAQAQKAYEAEIEKRHAMEKKSLDDFLDIGKHPKTTNNRSAISDFIAANGNDAGAFPALNWFVSNGHSMFEVPTDKADPLYDEYHQGRLTERIRRSLFGKKHGGQGKFSQRNGNDTIIEKLAKEYGIEVNSQGDAEAVLNKAIAEYESYLQWKNDGAKTASDIEAEAYNNDILSRVTEDEWRQHEKALSEMVDVDTMRKYGLIDFSEAKSRKIDIAMRPENAEIYRKLGEANPAHEMDDFYTADGHTLFSVGAHPYTTDEKARETHETAVSDISKAIIAASPTSEPALIDRIVRHSVQQVREDKQAAYAKTVSKNAKAWITQNAKDRDPAEFVNSEFDGELPIPLEMRADKDLPDLRFSVTMGKNAKEEARKAIEKYRPDIGITNEYSDEIERWNKDDYAKNLSPYMWADDAFDTDPLKEYIKNRRINETIGEIEKFPSAKERKAALYWFCKATVRLPEDAPKVTEALKTAERAKVDPFQYERPGDILEQFAEYRPKEKPINPDTVPELTDRREMGHGIVTYLVKDDEQGQAAMRRIINTHFGKDASPWCLLQGDKDGNLTSDAWHYWNHYNALPKRVAFKDGKLVAFMATDRMQNEIDLYDYAPKNLQDEFEEWKRYNNGDFRQFMKWEHAEELAEIRRNLATEQWWDRTDAPHDGIPFTEKDGDRTMHQELASNGKVTTHRITKGDRKADGVYEEWFPNATGSETHHTRLERKNGLPVKGDAFYSNGQAKQIAEYKDEERTSYRVNFDEIGQISQLQSYNADGDSILCEFGDNNTPNKFDLTAGQVFESFQETWDDDGRVAIKVEFTHDGMNVYNERFFDKKTGIEYKRYVANDRGEFHAARITDADRMYLPPITREMIEEKARQILNGETVAPFSSLMKLAKDASPTRYSVRRAMQDLADGKEFGELHNQKYGTIKYPIGKSGKKGYGLLHIVEQRMTKDGATLDEALDTAIKVGEAAEIGKETLTRYNTHHLDLDGTRAIIGEMPDNTIVITGYEIMTDDSVAANRRASELSPRPHVRSEEVIRRLKEKLASTPRSIPYSAAESQPPARHSVRLDEAKKLMPNTKVVDRNGNPSIMYHGTYWDGRDLPDGEAVFNSSRGIHVGTYEAAVQRITRSNNPEEQELPEDADIIELFVNITNPFVVEGDPFVYEDLAAREFIRISKERKLLKNDEFDAMVQNQDIPSAISYLKSIGYDGIKYRNSIEDRGSTSWVAFEPNQVKEASVWNKSRMDLNNKDFRHSVRVPGSDTNRIALKYYLAREIVENGRLPDHRHAAFVARSMGVGASDIPAIIREAKTEADEQTKALRYVAGDPKVEKAISRAGLSYRYENAIRRARRTAIKYSRDVSEAKESVDRSMNRAIRAVKGEDYDEMLVRDGIDINAILKAMRPAETAPSTPTEEASGTDGSGSAAEPANPTPETQAKGREAAHRAIERATELVRKAKEQLVRKAKEQLAEGEDTATKKQEAAGEPTEDNGANGEKEEAADTNAGLIEQAFHQAIAESGITLDSPAAVVQLVRAITENYITENPEKVSDLDPEDVFSSPIARAMLAGNIASFAQAVAAAYSPSHARIRIARKAQLLNDRSVNSLAAIERIGEEIFRDLNRDIIRQSRNSLIREIKKIVTDPAKHFAERVENKDRTLSADAAQYCKFARWAMNVPAAKVEETAAELERFLQGYGAGEISDKDKARYRDYAEAQMKLSLLDTFANLRNRMPAELVQIRDFIGQLVDEGKFDAMCFSEKWERTRKAVVDAAVPGIAGDPKNKGRQPEKTSILYSLVGMMEPKWKQLTRFCRDKVLRDRSVKAMATVEEMIQTANDREYNYLSDGKKKLTDLLVATYGSEKAAKKALREDIDESLWADLDRGDQHTEWTIGRVMQMYVSVVQSDYADNVAKWNRGNDYVALLEQVINDADPRHMDLIRGLRQLYLEQGETLSEVTLKTAGVPILTPNQNYMPVVTMNDHNVAKKVEARAYSPFAPSLTPRVKHGLDFDQTADIIDVFTDRLQDAAHTIGWADTGSLVMGICQSDEVLNAIRQAHGRTAMSQWNNYILDVVAGTQERRAGGESNFIRILARLASRTWIALNPVSWAKQIESYPCYALCNDGRLRDLWNNSCFWALHPMQGLQAARDLARTKAFSARYGLEISQELKYATSDEGAFKSWRGRTMDKEMAGVYIFDKLGVYMLAGIYRRRRAELERDGMSTDEASETAASWLMHIVDKTAQTARTVNTTQLQRAGGAWALVLQFKSAPAQQTQFEIAALQDAIAAPNDAARWKKAAAVICINHLIVPTINTAIEGLLMMLTNLGLPDEEKRKRLAALFAANVLSGSLGSIAFLGTAIEGISRAAADFAIEGKVPNAYTLKDQPIPAYTLIGQWANSYNKATKAFEELQWGDVEDGVIDMALAIGDVIPGLSWASRTTEKIKKTVQED